MGRHTVEIGDDKGNSFRISVNIDYLGVHTEGSWRTIDKGWLRYNSGTAKKYQTDGWTITETNLFLFQPGEIGSTYEIRFDKWDDYGGVNDQGTGFMSQNVVINATPGKISWALVE
jgi:hypothetical protein